MSPTDTSKLTSELKERKEDISNQVEKQKELNKRTLAKFEEGIAELKKVDLHPALGSSNMSKLIDVYHSEANMRDYRSNCMQMEANLTTNMERIAERSRSLKNLIKSHKMKVKEHVSEWVEIESNLCQQFKAVSDNFEASALKFTKEFFNLRERLRATEEDKVDDCLILLGLYDFYVANFTVYEQNFINLEGQVLSLNNDIQKMIRSSIDNETIVKENVKLFEKIEGSIQTLSRNLSKLVKENLGEVEKVFSRMLTPGLMKGAYDDLLVEISRRRETLNKLNEISQTAKHVIEEENKKRSDFLNRNGNILPDKLMNIVPTLKHQIDFRLIINTQELEALPVIEVPRSAEKVTPSPNNKQEPVEPTKMTKLFELFSLSSELTEEVSIEDFEKSASNRPKLVSLLKNLLLANTKFLLRQIAQNYTYYEPSEAKREINRLAKEFDDAKGSYNAEMQNSRLLTENIEALLTDNKRQEEELSGLRSLLFDKERRIEELMDEKEVQDSEHEQEINSRKFTTSNLSSLCEELTKKLDAKQRGMERLIEMLQRYSGITRVHIDLVDDLIAKNDCFGDLNEKIVGIGDRLETVKNLMADRASESLASTLLVPNKLTNYYSSPSNAETESETVDLNNLQDTIETLRIENKEYKLRIDLLEQSLDSKREEVDALRIASKSLEEDLRTSKAFAETVLLKLEANRKNKEEYSFEAGDTLENKTMVFVPFEPGVYVPLVSENSNYVLNQDSRHIRYVLEVDSLPAKYSTVARNNNFIIIAKVSGNTKPSDLAVGGCTFPVEQLAISQLQGLYTFDEANFTLYTLVD